jgi:peptidoglycan/LPS O-acetylase OafA/YrhL
VWYPEPVLSSKVDRSPYSYRSDIDGLRAVSVISVVVYHLFPDTLSGGFIGVDVFFVISGFLITQIIWHQIASGQFSFSDFYRRRIRRLFPALALVLATTFLCGALLFNWSELAHLGKHTLASTLFFSNFALWLEGGYFDIAAERKPLLHIWSLSIEEQFYLLWPFLLIVTHRMGVRFFTMAAVFGSVSFALSVYLSFAMPIAGFYNPVGRFWELLLGAVLGVFMVDNSDWSPTPSVSALMSFAGILCIAFSSIIFDRETLFPGVAALAPCFGAALILVANSDNVVSRRTLSNPFMVGIGLISYPLYLWHWPLLSGTYILLHGQISSGIRAIIGVASFILAGLTYVFVERTLRFGPRGGVKTFLLLGCMVVVGIVGGTAWYSEGFFRWSKVVSDAPFLSRSVTRGEWSHSVREGECYLQGRNDLNHHSTCLGSGHPQIVLWGDSHVASLYPGLRKLKEKIPIGLTQWTQGACPPLDESESRFNSKCDEINQRILNAVAEIKPEAIILGAAWVHPEYPLTNAQIISKLSGLVLRIKSFTPASHILIVGPLPRWYPSLPEILRDYVSKNGRIPPVYLPRPNNQELTTLRELDSMFKVAASTLGVTYISPEEVFCTTSGCLTRTADTPEGLVSFDYGHLNPSGAEFFIKHISSKIFD